MYKAICLSHGLRLTQSDDMGIFLHFATKDGQEKGGICLDRNPKIAPGKEWALEILESVADSEPPPEPPET